MNLNNNTKITEFTTEVALGNVLNVSTWNKWGYNDDIDTGGEEIIASWGGVWQPPTTAETVDFVSTSADDTDGGIGMNSIVVYGVIDDGSGNRTSVIEVLTLNGLTPVTTTNAYYGINRVAPFLCGTSLANVGKITGDQSTSGIILAELPIGEAVTQQAIFYVQSGYTFLTSNLHINIVKLSGGGLPTVTIRGYVYSPVANANIQIFKAKVDTQIENTVNIDATETFPVTESSVLYFTAETDTNNTSVDLRFSGKEIKND